MKSAHFWEWFASISSTIAERIESDRFLVAEIDKRVLMTWPQLAWEIGSDSDGSWYFALSPNLRRDLAKSAKDAVRGAPPLQGWNFYPARQKKNWEGRFELEGSLGTQFYNASTWWIHDDLDARGVRKILLISSDAASMNPQNRWYAAAIVLESIFGEEYLLSEVDEFDLIDTHQFNGVSGSLPRVADFIQGTTEP